MFETIYYLNGNKILGGIYNNIPPVGQIVEINDISYRIRSARFNLTKSTTKRTLVNFDVETVGQYL